MPVKVISSVTKYQGRVFNLVTEHIALGGGVSADMDIIHHPGAAAIIPFPDTETVILIKQYRHAVGEHIWEIPAGTLNQKEAAIDCARRELVEETGYSADTWQKLGEIIPVPGYSDERIQMFLASDLAPAEQNLDQDEILAVHAIKFEDALQMIYNGKIRDSKTISGLFMAMHRLQQKTTR